MTQLSEPIYIFSMEFVLHVLEAYLLKQGSVGELSGILFALTYFSIYTKVTSTAIVLKQRACVKQ